ncbi:MAG: AtpZ/AtpI family protein [Hymenobacteraceae bacterium]|nr:AtpZ/AtpI family protein [Hymenobacteraceae bacterium]
MSTEPSPERKPSNAIVKYSGMAFQMLAIIGGCTWLGMWLDRRLGLSTPWLTLGLALFGVVGAMWRVIREANDDAR